MLIDGDLTTRGLSRFMHTGPVPGLAELAAGEATLGEATRMWNLDGASRMPVLPAGASGRSETKLRSAAVAEAVDVLTENADLVIIDSPPILWDGTSRPLAAHADGTVMVVSANADHEAVMKARTVLSDIGAPLLGYVVNRSGASKPGRQPWVRAIKRAVATFLVVMVATVGWNAVQLWRSWQSVEREGFEPAAAATLLPLPSGGIVAPPQLTSDITTAVTSPPADDAAAQAFLIIGSDLTYENADVIILAMLPGDGSAPVMTSLPRDLYLPNRCTQGYARINSNLSGCGSEINGPTLLALAVEDFTGIPVDHFALFDFEGFERIIDAVGGVDICVDYAVRDAKSFLDLPAGCSSADGAQALAWVRSRSTQEYVDGRWRTMAGVNDLTRNERQQDVLIQMFAKMREFGSPGELTKKVRSLTDAFTLDDGLRLTAAIDLAWDLRNSSIDEFVRVTIPVIDFLTDDGAQVLLPTQSFDQVLAAARPELAPESDPTVVR
jgi:LCP family protein required for cell wall assembly